jgi:hypothetical protein
MLGRPSRKPGRWFPYNQYDNLGIVNSRCDAPLGPTSEVNLVSRPQARRYTDKSAGNQTLDPLGGQTVYYKPVRLADERFVDRDRYVYMDKREMMKKKHQTTEYKEPSREMSLASGHRTWLDNQSNYNVHNSTDWEVPGFMDQARGSDDYPTHRGTVTGARPRVSDQPHGGLTSTNRLTVIDIGLDPEAEGVTSSANPVNQGASAPNASSTTSDFINTAASRLPGKRTGGNSAISRVDVTRSQSKFETISGNPRNQRFSVQSDEGDIFIKKRDSPSYAVAARPQDLRLLTKRHFQSVDVTRTERGNAVTFVVDGDRGEGAFGKGVLINTAKIEMDPTRYTGGIPVYAGYYRDGEERLLPEDKFKMWNENSVEPVLRTTDNPLSFLMRPIFGTIRNITTLIVDPVRLIHPQSYTSPPEQLNLRNPSDQHEPNHFDRVQQQTINQSPRDPNSLDRGMTSSHAWGHVPGLAIHIPGTRNKIANVN